MPNTANYSFPTPADTDLVKNGADAIRDLGDAVDTAMNTALGTKKSGLVLLNTTSFSAVASFSLPVNTFSATYDRYLIVITGTSTGASGDATFRMRAAGVDASAANYGRGYLYNTSGGTAGAATQTAQTAGWYSFHSASDFKFSARVEIIDPFLTSPTLVISHSVNKYAANSIFGFQYNSGLDNTTSYDSATFFTPSTNMTGSYSVYGYNK